MLLLSLFVLSAVVVGQPHNTWTSGAPIPVPVIAPDVGALNIGGLKGQINVIGGWDGSNGFTVYSYNQIYYPVSNTWSTGAVLPTANYGGAVGVVKNVLYLFGGTPDGSTVTNAVWAYNPKTDSWSPRTAMPTARVVARAVVENNIIYVIGGQDANFNQLATVESYNPATDTWTEDAPMLVAKSFISAGALGTKIVAADGRTSTSDPGDTESYSLATTSWSSLTPDPTGRDNSCAGAVGATQLYVTGGRVPGGVGTPALDLSESFNIVNNAWTTLASMPQRTEGPGSAAYNGRLYCFGGQASQGSQVALGNVQIYQP
jgi:N-acetylneuraminic acid mutarotase